MRIDSRCLEAVIEPRLILSAAIVAGILVGSYLKTADDLFDSQTSRRTESKVLSLRFSGLPDITSVTRYSSTSLTTI